MTEQKTPDELRNEIADLDDQLRMLRGETAGVASDVGGQADGAIDQEEAASALTGAEEDDALIATLEARRQTLQDRLDRA